VAGRLAMTNVPAASLISTRRRGNEGNAAAATEVLVLLDDQVFAFGTCFGTTVAADLSESVHVPDDRRDPDYVTAELHGSAVSAIAYAADVISRELTKGELAVDDPTYPVLIGVAAAKAIGS